MVGEVSNEQIIWNKEQGFFSFEKLLRYGWKYVKLYYKKSNDSDTNINNKTSLFFISDDIVILYTFCKSENPIEHRVASIAIKMV